MARKAARVVGGATGITSSSQTALGRLPSYKRAYVKARVEGRSVRASADEAGISGMTGRRYEKQADIQAAYRELMQKAIPAKKLVNLIKGGCEAKMPVFNAQGRKVSERADWKTRRPYIEIAAEHGGYHENKNVGAAGASITFNVNHIGQNAPNQRIIEVTAETDGTS